MHANFHEIKLAFVMAVRVLALSHHMHQYSLTFVNINLLKVVLINFIIAAIFTQKVILFGFFDFFVRKVLLKIKLTCIKLTLLSSTNTL